METVPTRVTTPRPPTGLRRWALRLPILLFRLHLDRLLGERVARLTHTGRSTGLPRHVALEITGRDPLTGDHLLASGFGPASQWYRNVRRTPEVTLRVGGRTLPATGPAPGRAGGGANLSGIRCNPPFATPVLRSDARASDADDGNGSGMTDEEFDAFYVSSFSLLVRQIYAMTGDYNEAQDAVQEAFLRAWGRRGQLSGSGSPHAWIRTVAWRLAVSRWRRARRGLDLVFRNHLHEDAPGPGPEHTALVAGLRKLPAAQRQAIVLFHLCDLTVAEVARETGVAEGTVKARLSRGRAALAEHLSDRDERELIRA